MKRPKVATLPVRPTHDYIGRAACGCVTAIGWDTGDKDTAAMTAEWIKKGLTIERMTIAEASSAHRIGMDCTHSQAAPKPPAELVAVEPAPANPHPYSWAALSDRERLERWNAGQARTV